LIDSRDQSTSARSWEKNREPLQESIFHCVRAWLFRIARNASINHLTRRSTRGLPTGDDDFQRLLVDLPSSERQLSTEIDIEYRREVFRWAADQVRHAVTEKTWQSFWLTHVQQQPIPAVAEELGISVGSVYVGRSRVMARLREVVKSLEDAQ
jgi:RNA polymerase sigma-70 factor (ECF subfamily)